MDIIPIILDEPKELKECYEVALSKIIRQNDYNIIDSKVTYHESSIKVELYIKSSKELIEKFQSIRDLKTNNESNINDKYTKYSKDAIASAEAMIDRMRSQSRENNPF